MSLDSKLKIIKKIKEQEFFKYILNNIPFPKDENVTIFLNGIRIGEMDVKCISLINPQLDVQYFVQNEGRFNLIYGSDKKVENIMFRYSHKQERAYVLVNKTNITFTYLDDSFITLDHTNDYKITDSSCKSVIDAYLFRNPYKTFNKETTTMLKLSDF